MLYDLYMSPFGDYVVNATETALVKLLLFGLFG